jgi:hypothetical protein
MRNFLFLVILALCTGGTLYAQNNTKETYLAAKVISKYNNLPDETYFTLVVDVGNDFAAALYKLKDFDKRLSAKDTAYSFYKGLKVDTAVLYHNYFVSETAALNFIGGMGWKLLAINNNISSTAGHTLGDVYSDIRSVATFYFKKQIE